MRFSRFALVLFVAWIGGTLLVSPRVSLADDGAPTWQYGLSLSYLTGDYGQDRDTDLFYTAATLKRYFEQGDVTLTIPYLDSSSGGVTVVGGEVEPIQDGNGGSGLGDIILKGRYYWIAQDGWIPFIDLVGSVKFPTADDDKGLGTGEFDFTGMVEFARRLEGTPWIALGELGYGFIGEPPGTDADNRFLYSVGAAYEFNPKVTLSGYLDGRTAIFEGNEDPLSVLLIGEYKYRPSLRFDTLLEIGLSDGSPDFGITFGIRKRM